MIVHGSPYEDLKVLVIGLYLGYLFGRWKFRRPKCYEFTNLRFGDLNDRRRIKL